MELLSVQQPLEAREAAASSVVTITTDESSQECQQEEVSTSAGIDQRHQHNASSPSRVKWIQREEEAQESILAKLAKVVEPFLNKENKKGKNVKNNIHHVVQVPFHPQPTSRQRSRSHSADGSRRIDDHPLSPQYPLRYPKVSQSSPVRNIKGKENQPSASKSHSHKQQHISTNNTSSSSINRSSSTNVSGSFAFAELALELQNERTENLALKQHIASLEKQLSFARTESDRTANSHRSLVAQQTRDNAALRSHLTQVTHSLTHKPTDPNHHLTYLTCKQLISLPTNEQTSYRVGRSWMHARSEGGSLRRPSVRLLLLLRCPGRRPSDFVMLLPCSNTMCPPSPCS